MQNKTESKSIATETFFFFCFSVSLPALSVASSLHSVDAVEMTTGVFGCVHAQVERGALREKARDSLCMCSPAIMSA